MELERSRDRARPLQGQRSAVQRNEDGARGLRKANYSGLEWEHTGLWQGNKNIIQLQPERRGADNEATASLL